MLRQLKAVEGKRVVVWGDLVADHTIYGDTSRISREAPVLILQKEWDAVTPGGAGNAVRNVAALGGVPIPVGAVGSDEMGERLLSQLREEGVNTEGVTQPSGCETAIKMRVLAGGLHTVKQQVIRIDSPGTYTEVDDALLRERLAAALKGADAVIVSDYGLGTTRPALFQSVVRPGQAISVIDSRHEVASYAGAVSATPNEPELEEQARISIGDDEETLERAARELLKRVEFQALLVTRGKQGMALFEPGRQRLDIPVWRTQEIVDVTGAGDTVIAMYTLGLAAGMDFASAARMANVAAGLSVMKRGASPPAAADVRRALEGEA